MISLNDFLNVSINRSKVPQCTERSDANKYYLKVTFRNFCYCLFIVICYETCHIPSDQNGTHGSGEKRVQGFLVGKPEGKRRLRRPRHRWEDGIKMDLKEIGWGVMEWIHLAQDRDRWRAVVNVVMNLWLLAPRS
jgi:hypothetical protein